MRNAIEKIFLGPVEACRRELSRLKTAELELISRLQLAERSEAEVDVDAAIDSPDLVSSLAGAIAKARATAEAARATIQVVRAKRMAALRALGLARADELRARAAELQREAASTRDRGRAAWQALLDAEQIMAFDAVGNMRPLADYDQTVFMSPRSARLVAEAGPLINLAEALTRNPVTAQGHVDVEAATIDSLVEAVLASETAGPSALEVVAWWAISLGLLRKDLPAFSGKIRARLSWRAGTIIAANSSLGAAIPDPNRTGLHSTERWITREYCAA